MTQREKQLLETAEKISERIDSEKQEIEAVMAGISQLKSKQEIIPEKKTKLQEELENHSSRLKSRQRGNYLQPLVQTALNNIAHSYFRNQRDEPTKTEQRS